MYNNNNDNIDGDNSGSDAESFSDRTSKTVVREKHSCRDQTRVETRDDVEFNEVPAER